MARHARLGASNSDIWLACLGAPREWLTRPPRRVGFAAREGTLAHTLAEAITARGATPAWVPGTEFNVEGTNVPVTQEMLDGVKMFTDTVRILSEFALWKMIEGEVNLSWLWAGSEPPEEIFGTLDFASCDGLTLYIADFKFGAGKAIKVDANTQLMFYALGALGKLLRERPDLFDSLEAVSLAVVQPRAGGSPVRQWTISVGDLLYWGFAVLKPSVEKIIFERDLPLVSGRHCYFCPASIDCKVYLKMKRDRETASIPDYDPAKEDLEFEEAI